MGTDFHGFYNEWSLPFQMNRSAVVSVSYLYASVLIRAKGAWAMANGKWQMADGRWQNGRRRIVGSFKRSNVKASKSSLLASPGVVWPCGEKMNSLPSVKI
jgi:hypothetical protein